MMLHIGKGDNYRAMTCDKIARIFDEIGKPLERLILEVSPGGGLNIFERISRDEMDWLGTIDLAFESWEPYEGSIGDARCDIPDGWKKDVP